MFPFFLKFGRAWISSSLLYWPLGNWSFTKYIMIISPIWYCFPLFFHMSSILVNFIMVFLFFLSASKKSIIPYVNCSASRETRVSDGTGLNSVNPLESAHTLSFAVNYRRTIDRIVKSNLAQGSIKSHCLGWSCTKQHNNFKRVQSAILVCILVWRW